MYNGYYGGDGFKFQFVTSPCGIIEDCSGPYGGRISDSEMYLRSQLDARFARFCDIRMGNGTTKRHKMYGDSAYAQSQYCDKPFSREIATPAQENHNALMSSVRVSVEHLIGSVSQVFPALDMTRYQRTGQTTVGLIFLVSVIMRNFLTCVRGSNQVSEFFRLAPPSLQNFCRPRPGHINPRIRELRILTNIQQA